MIRTRQKKLDSVNSLADPSVEVFSPKVKTSVCFRKSNEGPFHFNGSQSTFNRSTALGTEYKSRYQKKLLNNPSVMDETTREDLKNYSSFAEEKGLNTY